MVNKILNAHRGDQSQNGATAKPNRIAHEVCSGDFAPEISHV